MALVVDAVVSLSRRTFSLSEPIASVSEARVTIGTRTNTERHLRQGEFGSGFGQFPKRNGELSSRKIDFTSLTIFS